MYILVTLSNYLSIYIYIIIYYIYIIGLYMVKQLNTRIYPGMYPSIFVAKKCTSVQTWSAVPWHPPLLDKPSLGGQMPPVTQTLSLILWWFVVEGANKVWTALFEHEKKHMPKEVSRLVNQASRRVYGGHRVRWAQASFFMEVTSPCIVFGHLPAWPLLTPVLHKGTTTAPAPVDAISIALA